jgi:hypothetical protein
MVVADAASPPKEALASELSSSPLQAVATSIVTTARIRILSTFLMSSLLLLLLRRSKGRAGFLEPGSER